MNNIKSHQLLGQQSTITLLNQGSAEAFITALTDEVQSHKALNHPYLVALSTGEFPNMKEALRDYAHQYSFYSSNFVNYLDGVLKTLTSQSHIDTIMENVEEEKGKPDAEQLVDRPHVEIFEYFKRSVGVDEAYEASHPISTTVSLWRDLFLQKCNSNIRGVGIGAIGIATENIVPYIYRYILSGIEKHSNLSKDAGLFFELHINCDDGHGDDFMEITTEIAEDFSTREAIRFGVFSSLNLRLAFWDSQLARAVLMKPV